jgi:hypothetical protein
VAERGRSVPSADSTRDQNASASTGQGITEPDLFFDGRSCCDQTAAHYLVHAGLITAAALGLVGRRVDAVLTPAGHQALDAYALAA